MTDDWSREWRGEDEEAGEAISDLLDEGYDLLDGYVNWSEERLKLGTRIAQQDCFNAECLIDYLANFHRKSVRAVNEFELRWFVFSHYIRKSMADVETEERLLESLNRFFGYLESEHAFVIKDWILTTLDESSYYAKRRQEYRALNSEDEREWEIGFRDWSTELEQDLDSRCLWLPREIGNGLIFLEVMGWREATLYAEANRLWQEERDELVLEGLDYEAIYERLKISLLEWIDTPQERLDGLTPIEVIQGEREEHPVQDEDENDEASKWSTRD